MTVISEFEFPEKMFSVEKKSLGWRKIDGKKIPPGGFIGLRL